MLCIDILGYVDCIAFFSFDIFFMEKKCEHVAIILDGNGRWAKRQGKPRTYGHSVGADNVETICRGAYDLGVRYLTVYAFSTENWKRPKLEVETIMKIIGEYVDKCVSLAEENNMRVRFIGDLDGLSDWLRRKVDNLTEKSRDYTGLTLTIAINYGARDEIIRAIEKLRNDPSMDGVSLTEEKFSTYLDTEFLPDPDLLIRTAGEQRLSNYLLWQLCYSELMFTELTWPEFTVEELSRCIDAYKRRNRSYGGIK